MISEKLKRRYICFTRPGCSNIKKWKLIVGAIFLLPIRFPTFLFNLMLMWLNYFVFTIGLNVKKPYPQWRISLMHFFGKYQN